MKDTVLLVDDEPLVLKSLTRSLRNDRYEIITALSGEEALEIMRKRDINVVISDQSMPRIQGIEFLVLVKMYRPATVRILLTGNADLKLAVEAVNQSEVFRFLTKPWNDGELREVIGYALEKSHAQLSARGGGSDLQQQPGELNRLELLHNGISLLNKDADGSLILPEISDEELDKLLNRASTL